MSIILGMSSLMTEHRQYLEWFRDVEAQHHLVQEKVNERPDIPGLTPEGFETWATLLLRAHPDQEYERLAKTALDMPISNPDDKKERFPKELSRRLLPKTFDTEIAYKIQKAMSTHCSVTFSSKHSSTPDSHAPPPPSTKPSEESVHKNGLRPSVDSQDPSSSDPQPSPALSYTSIERQRQPYSGVPIIESINGAAATVEEDGEDMPTPQPIERERQPYVAAPGVGKNYDNLNKTNSIEEVRPAVTQPEPKLGRSGSVRANATQSKPTPIAIHQKVPPPMDGPEVRRHRANSVYHKDQPRRTRSPSASADNGTTPYMRRSESDVQYGTSPYHHTTPTNSNNTYEDARRYKEYEAQRERLANDRYDAARMSAYDPREREKERDRENRPRMQSVSGFDSDPRASWHGSTMHSDEEYYRDRGHAAANGSYNPSAPISTGFQPPVYSNAANGREAMYGSHPLSARYPPTSYKDT